MGEISRNENPSTNQSMNNWSVGSELATTSVRFKLYSCEIPTTTQKVKNYFLTAVKFVTNPFVDVHNKYQEMKKAFKQLKKEVEHVKESVEQRTLEQLRKIPTIITQENHVEGIPMSGFDEASTYKTLPDGLVTEIHTQMKNIIGKDRELIENHYFQQIAPSEESTEKTKEIIKNFEANKAVKEFTDAISELDKEIHKTGVDPEKQNANIADKLNKVKNCAAYKAMQKNKDMWSDNPQCKRVFDYLQGLDDILREKTEVPDLPCPPS